MLCVLEAEEICLFNKDYKEDLNASHMGKVLLLQRIPQTNFSFTQSRENSQNNSEWNEITEESK